MRVLVFAVMLLLMQQNLFALDYQVPNVGPITQQVVAEKTDSISTLSLDRPLYKDLISLRRELVQKNADMAKYGVDLISFKNRDDSFETVKLRGGINKLSTKPTAAIQLIVHW
jgi:hypothetical protein